MGLFVDEYLEYLKGQLAMCDYVLLPLASDVEIMDFDSKMINVREIMNILQLECACH